MVDLLLLVVILHLVLVISHLSVGFTYPQYFNGGICGIFDTRTSDNTNSGVFIGNTG